MQITDLPIELLIDYLLPCIPLQDLLSLSCTCKYFAIVCGDDTFWKRKTSEEYNFEGAGSARTSGFKYVYRGLRHPRVFVWGDGGNSRLALDKRKHRNEHDYNRNIDYPIELDMRHRVVHLAAGGWSFHALTDEGKVLVWGTLDSSSFETGNDLGLSSTEVGEPLVLNLPQRIKSLSVGRRHAVLFDGGHTIYIILQWGRPIRLDTPALDGTRPESTVVQVEAGWDVCAFLTQTGTAFVIFPFHGSFSTGDKFVVGLTDGGHVLKLDLPTYDQSELGRIISRGDLRWNYLPKFSDVTHVRNEPGFRPQGQEQAPALEDLKVTHISAQFRTFVVYSTVGSSVVLLGDDHNNSQSPKIIPELQNRGVISVVLGDYHYCALTSRGELFSWGKYSNGALGLGRPTNPHGRTLRLYNMTPQMMPYHFSHSPPQDAEVPTQVHFHHEDNVKDRYVFAVTASGWHCGALVIDLHSTSTSTEGKSNPTQEVPVKQDHDRPSHTNMEYDAHNNEASRQSSIAPFPTRPEAERAAGTQVPQITSGPIEFCQGCLVLAKVYHHHDVKDETDRSSRFGQHFTVI
ncbi:hypothetical protein OPQ81_007993 [Rhizoctonia solani]|nr:hypothetical protein OPQ81_007993 [Rhizoctonia solani]